MSRRKRHNSRGPFTFADLYRAFKRDGWIEVQHGKHVNMKHPTKKGKLQLNKKWDGVRAGDGMFNSLCRTSGLSKKQLLDLLNQ